MPLVHNRYGKDRVRVMRVHRDGERHEVRELTVQAMVEGDFSRAYTSADNSACLSTDTIKNVVNVVARENLALDTELFCKAVADKLLSGYPQVESAFVSGHQTKWTRLAFGGVPHPHGFVLDANGKPFCEVRVSRSATSFVSGVAGYTFMKSTGVGLGRLCARCLHDARRDRRSHLRDGHGCQLGVEPQPCGFHCGERDDPVDHDRGVRHHL